MSCVYRARMLYIWVVMLALAGIGSTVVGTMLAVMAAIYPAAIASRMVPASALRSTV
jgi:ABC-type lipoprotein release transport system permease subunit